MTQLGLEEFKPCGKCNNGFLISKSGFASKCQCRIDHENRSHEILIMRKANLIDDNTSRQYFDFLSSYNFLSYKGPDNEENLLKLKKYTDRFTEKYSAFNLFFYGLPGTQKTTLAKYLILRLLRQGKTGYYILVNDYIMIAEESIRNEEKKKLLDYINSVDLLVLDEFDEDKIIMYSSNWKESNLFPQIKYRLEMVRKSTIFCSNRHVDSLGNKFEGAIQNLIERETLNGLFTFSDVYAKFREKVDLSKIWED